MERIKKEIQRPLQSDRINKVKITVALIFLLHHSMLANKIWVGINKEVKSIACAISEAQAFDSILVSKNHYKEHSLLINKPLAIIGINEPIIDATHLANEIFIITADYVKIQGFVLQNVGVSYLHEFAAIKVRNAKHGKICSNTLKNCFFGIYLENAEDFLVEKNKVFGTIRNEASIGNAIHVWKAVDITIEENILTGHRDGIYFEFVNHSYIRKNKSWGNVRYGLHFMFSNHDEYLNNQFKNNGAGVAVMFSRHIKMLQNEFSENWGGASYGLLLKEISDGEISNNQFIKNTIGILSEGANRLIIRQNTFILNGTALDIKGNTLDSYIEKNNFIANTFEVTTNSKYNNNSYNLNYWSKYNGYDLNKDGMGDIPYRPVNLFGKIIKQIPAATIMIHSLFVKLLEITELIVPHFIPPELIDNSPVMKPYDYDKI